MKKVSKRHSKLKPKIYPKVIKKLPSKHKKTDKNLQIELNAIEIEEEKLQEEFNTKYMIGDVLSNENKEKLKIIKSKKKIIEDQIKKLANIEIEKENKKQKYDQQQHTKHHRKDSRKHHRSSSISSLSNQREERDRHTFSNSFYSQNDLFKYVPKQKQNQKKNHKGKDKKGDHKHDKKGDQRHDKKGDQRHDKKSKNKEEQKLNSIPITSEISSNETNIKKEKKKPEPKEKSAEEIYESMKEDHRKMLFISYVEFLIRNNIEGLHYYKFGKKNREEDYVLVSHLLEENPKYGKIWEKQLYKKIHDAIGRDPESYWILELFTGKKYKSSFTNNIGEKEKYQKQFIQTLQNPNLAQPFINQITH